MPFVKSITAGYVLFCVPKENQKGRRCPQGMKAPVGLLSRRPVCEANAACSARQGLRYFRGAGGDGLRLPASASCLGRHSHPAGRGPNSSSLFLPQAAVVAVANHGLLALNDPKADGLHTKNPSRCARGFFVFRRFIVAARRRKSDSSNMPFPVTTLPVKMRLERSAERDKRELVGARPLHLADARPFGRLKAPLGLSLFRFASQTRIMK